MTFPILMIVTLAASGRRPYSLVYCDGRRLERFASWQDASAYAVAFYDGIGHPGYYRGIR